MKKKNNNQNDTAKAINDVINDAENEIESKVNGEDDDTNVAVPAKRLTDEEEQIIAAYYAQQEKKAKVKTILKILAIGLGVGTVGGIAAKTIGKKREDTTEYIDVPAIPVSQPQTTDNTTKMDIADVDDLEDLTEDTNK